MSELTIQFGTQSPLFGPVAVPMEIQDDACRPVLVTEASIGRNVVVPVRKGSHHIFAYMPSGRKIQVQVDVKEGENLNIAIDPKFESYDSAVDERPIGEAHCFVAGKTNASSIELKSFSGRPLTLHFYRAQRMMLEPVPPPVLLQERLAPNGVARFHFDLQNSAGHWVQINWADGNNERWLALPPTSQIALLVWHEAAQEDNISLPNVLAEGGDRDAESVLAYWRSGQREIARKLAGEFLEKQDPSGQDWHDHPIQGIITGYLSCGMPKLTQRRFIDALAQFADREQWSPDAAATYAAHLYSSGETEQAREMFIEAWHRGIPLYAQNHQKLYKALGWFTQWKRDTEELVQAYTQTHRQMMFASEEGEMTSIQAPRECIATLLPSHGPTGLAPL